MVKLALSLVALAMTGSVAAAPAPGGATPAVSGTTFSFEAWVEDIIAHPDTALTVDEALAAAEAADAVGSAGGLVKRATCGPSRWTRANGRDATACVDDLARKGNNGVMCTIPKNKLEIQMCQIRNAEVVGIKHGLAHKQGANCNAIARTVGRVFDRCWRADDTVSGSAYCVTNNNINVAIKGA
ncbi:uncharacterized protein B0H64DRAFT_442734 [Chaetomium fimeti]|uniref:Uncharacterized protein n=1 Tax=Chaetomium fimeti TaxID=1854472 RepID=A0AAE0LSZ6_9PEZI|nr:hypothetical protein B0H64DRAFT_442734 [Chaetomium fimeti]